MSPPALPLLQPGDKFGHLTLIGFLPRSTAMKGIPCLTKCDCGGRRVVSSHHIRSMPHPSCGCKQRAAQARFVTKIHLRQVQEVQRISWERYGGLYGLDTTEMVRLREELELFELDFHPEDLCRLTVEEAIRIGGSTSFEGDTSSRALSFTSDRLTERIRQGLSDTTKARKPRLAEKAPSKNVAEASLRLKRYYNEGYADRLNGEPLGVRVNNERRAGWEAAEKDLEEAAEWTRKAETNKR